MNQNLTAPRDGVGILRKTLTAMLKNDDTAADTKKNIYWNNPQLHQFIIDLYKILLIFEGISTPLNTNLNCI